MVNSHHKSSGFLCARGQGSEVATQKGEEKCCDEGDSATKGNLKNGHTQPTPPLRHAEPFVSDVRAYYQPQLQRCRALHPRHGLPAVDSPRASPAGGRHCHNVAKREYHVTAAAAVPCGAHFASALPQRSSPCILLQFISPLLCAGGRVFAHWAWLSPAARALALVQLEGIRPPPHPDRRVHGCTRPHHERGARGDVQNTKPLPSCHSSADGSREFCF